jgi:hypothetical protein
MESEERFVSRTMADGKVRIYWLVSAHQISPSHVEATVRATRMNDEGERLPTGPLVAFTGGFKHKRYFDYERAERAAIECAIARL